jgi:NAD(P)-dependent dehydrogenase (short-subunit alcohol dehydrogenase family)
VAAALVIGVHRQLRLNVVLRRLPHRSVLLRDEGRVVSLTKSTALDLADDGIRCNCYCPSSTETEMLSAAFAAAPDPQKVIDELTASHLVKRLGRPEDVAKLVSFLASDDSAFINGTAILIDGGALAWRGRRA